jgi:hypothetical protein
MAGISKTKYTSQNIDNMSFDDELKVKIFEIISKDGVLVNPATEETLLKTTEKPLDTEYVWTDGNLTQKIETYSDRTVTTVYTWSSGNLTNKEITIT